MKTAIFAGSFDPFTNGHLDILETSAKIFDKVIITVTNNTQKTYLLPAKVRTDLIKKSVKHIKNAKVDLFNGLTVEYAKKHDACFLIRGVRTPSDFEYETQMARINTQLSGNIKTILLPATKENDFISSSMIRELLINKCDIESFVPSAVSEYFLTNPICQK